MFYILPLKDITYSPNKTASALVLQYLHTQQFHPFLMLFHALIQY